MNFKSTQKWQTVEMDAVVPLMFIHHIPSVGITAIPSLSKVCVCFSVLQFLNTCLKKMCNLRFLKLCLLKAWLNPAFPGAAQAPQAHTDSENLVVCITTSEYIQAPSLLILIQMISMFIRFVLQR